MENRNMKLIVLMANLGFNDSSLAKKSGVSRRTVNLIKNGKVKGTVETFKKLAETLGVEINELIE